jgi:hypothetical protein
MYKIINSKMWLFALIIAVSMIGCGSDETSGDAGAVCHGAGCVSIGSSGDLEAAAGYVILAKSQIDTVSPSVVTGNVGLTPAARDYLTGWSETAAADASDSYATSAQVVAPFKLYAADYAVPTPSNLDYARISMEAAYADVLGRPHGVGATNLNLGGGTLTGLTLVPGTYTWDTPGDVNITGNITLTGSSTDVWIFQIANNLTMDAGIKIILAGGAVPQNVFWQIAGNSHIFAGANFKGIMLCWTDITFEDGSTIKGRLFSMTAVNLKAATVTQP